MQQGAYKGFFMNKKNIIRDKNYLKFIRGLECVVCGNPHVEAAHLRMNTDGGMGMKPSDCWVLPLCSAHHRLQHHIGEEKFWEGKDPHALCEDLYKVKGDIAKALSLIWSIQDD
mgnify:FL=1